MHFKKVPLVIAVLASPILSACGGGGDDDTIAFTSLDTLPDEGTVRLEGQANTASFSVNRNTGDLTLSAVETVGNARLDLAR